MSDYRTAYPDRYPILKAYAKENRANPTLAEDILWQHLRCGQIGIKFLRQHIIGDYIADFASREQGLIIEVDGAYHTEPQQQIEDALREEALEQMGYHVLRFTNEEILYDIDNVITQIENQLK